jgi:hypothetical protein
MVRWKELSRIVFLSIFTMNVLSFEVVIPSTHYDFMSRTRFITYASGFFLYILLVSSSNPPSLAKISLSG